MITITIQDADQVIARYRRINADEIPFALALSLTRVAQAGQSGVQVALPLRFTIRRLAWARQGIRITAARRSDANPQATVEDIHSYMDPQETGGTKYPLWDQFIAVPLKGARPTPRAEIPDNLRPHAIMASGLGFIRNGIMYLAQFKRGRARGPRGIGGMNSANWTRQILPMYALVKEAKIPARYGFAELIAVAAEGWPAEFDKAFNYAVTSAR